MAIDIGRESSWNEAMFKMARIHDSQNLINFYKRNLLGRSEGKFHYEHWFIEIRNLRDEGDSKYTVKEKQKVDKLEKLIEGLLRFKPAHTPYSKGVMGQSQISYLFNKVNYEILIDLIRDYERLVKELNDIHGLSTGNRKDSGYF